MITGGAATVVAIMTFWAAPPPPSPSPVIRFDQCPRFVEYAGCFYPAGADGASEPSIFVRPDAPDQDFVVDHELGHAYDYFDLDDGERARIMLYAGWRSWNPERFASFYAGCRLRLNPAYWETKANHVYGPWRSPRSVRQICRVIIRAGDLP